MLKGMEQRLSAKIDSLADEIRSEGASSGRMKPGRTTKTPIPNRIRV